MAKSKDILSVARIAHAGMVVKTGKVQCLMDPGLVPVMSGMYVLNPPIRVDLRKLRSQRFDAVIISHHHGDHFCLDSLNLLDRATLVVYPRDFPFIESALSRMGFENFKGIAPWEKFRIGDLTIMPTPSQADFPEMGMVFISGKRTFWNAVDTELDDATIRRVRRIVKRVDLMFCYYQLLIEWQVYRNGLGSDFSYSRHEKQLLDVVKTDPACYVPSSCGWLDLYEEWRNDRQFQMTEPQFMDDMNKLRPRMKGIRLGPGDQIDVHRNFAVKRSGLNFVRPVKQRYSHYDWRPDRGITLLADPNPHGYKLNELKRIVRNYFDGDFLRTLNSRDPSEVVRQWRAQRLLWRLEVVYPGGAQELRLLEFGPKKARWVKMKAECFPNIHTSTAASVIPGMLKAEMTPVQAMRLTRRMHRQYQMTPKGMRRTESTGSHREADPLAEALFFGVAERAILKQVIKLGF